MKTLILTALLILMFTGSISCGEFRPDPVREHIRIHGSGVDMTGIWSDGKTNYQLKRKGR
jgi:hypothetical protein